MRIISHALFFIATACPLVMACSSMPQCTIKGTVTSDLDYVWLYDMEGNPIDSCAVTDGAFNFTTDRKRPASAGLFIFFLSHPHQHPILRTECVFSACRPHRGPDLRMESEPEGQASREGEKPV